MDSPNFLKNPLQCATDIKRERYFCTSAHLQVYPYQTLITWRNIIFVKSYGTRAARFSECCVCM